MSARELKPVTARPGAVDIEGLADALAGTGPALLLLPPGPEAERIVEAVLPLAADGVPPDTAIVAATSGSTGPPKGVRLSAAALTTSARLTHEHLHGPGQWLVAMSPGRVAGLQALIRSRLAGLDPVAVDTTAGFTPVAFAAAAARLTPGVPHYTSMVPTQLIRLLDAGVDLTCFDSILLGAGPIPHGLPERAHGVGVRVVRTYGLTESCGGCVYEGRPLTGVGLRITAAGLIALTGPTLASGYLGHAAAPAGGDGPGFVGEEFITSDLGRIDDGVLRVLGRADDVILSGGVNVPAQSVEAVLAGHDSVIDVAVVGRPDPEWGEAVIAVVVPAAADVDAPTLRALVADRLGRAYAPREFVRVDALPVLASGKVDRATLRALIRRDAPG